MANVNVNLKIGNRSYNKTKGFNQVFENKQEVDNTDGFINLMSVSRTKGTSTVPSISCMAIHNVSDVPAEIQVKLQEFKDSSNVDIANSIDLGGGATVDRTETFILNAGDFQYFANGS